MAGRFSTIAIFALGFQLVMAYFDSINLFGMGNIATDTSNANPTSLLAGMGVNTCGPIPMGCSSIALIGGAVASSVLFFGAWAFATSLWLGYYAAALADINLTLISMFHLDLGAIAIVNLVVGSIFLTDAIMMYSWRDVQHN